MTANLVLIMTTAGDKSENESGISLEKIESDNVAYLRSYSAELWRASFALHVFRKFIFHL